MSVSRTFTRAAAATAVAAVAGLSINVAAFAADGPGPATATGWVNNVSTPHISVVGTPLAYDSVKKPQASDSTPAVGLTITGHANASTGLQYGQATQLGKQAYATKAFVQLDAPVVGTVGAPTYSASVAQMRVQCVSDAEGTPSGSVQVAASVPVGLAKMPAPGTTVYFGPDHLAGTTTAIDDWEMKVVYNEQSRTANGQLKVVGMHAYYNVAARLVAKPITGDLALGVVTCGKVNDAPKPEATPVADPTIASAGAGLALLGGFVALRRRNTRNQLGA